MYEVTPEDEEEKKQKKGLKKYLAVFGAGFYEIFETFVIAAAIVIFVYFFVASPHEVLGGSMEDNFWDGEYLLSDKISYKIKDPKRGDVVIFKQTETADYIKRVIGLPGDTVEIRDGYVYVNGDRLDEKEYLDSDVYTEDGDYISEGSTFTVPDGKYFVLGDNRTASSDSRAFGPIDEDRIKGRAILIYWPFTHLKTVKRPTYN